MTDIIRCKDVGHTYGAGPRAVVAVHSVSCVVPGGARIALTGPSGSGKSTLLHMMAGLERVTTGELTWPSLDGHPSGKPGAIGVIFQGPSLIPALNVVENVALPLVLDGVSDSAARRLARDALGELDLDWMSQKLPDELSGGQAQRVAIARVLCTQPTLILADEPTGQLDHETGYHVIDVLMLAADRLDATLLVSTHDPAIARRLGTQWQMHDGRLSMTGDRTTQTAPSTASRQTNGT
ncbi:putative ABC transport system ATP-binding protein [Cryobacterium sp. CAN_C3]|uniref:ABC transporter ATP-binding protein n=1 Tax=unclassified Cryobacterium TaxID=2649013 RepID=UPI0018CBD81B|nr:ATP-binding cassette domain-containing protein [Cryobacterium sp. CAN_C3]MEC5155425.1 putative ABC transport system ATP-binding protein [Cryobacterium sp. CAN_C3]